MKTMAALLILLLLIPVDHALAQPLPDSAKQPVRVHVTGDEHLNQPVHQEMALNLIAAEARIDPDSAVWLLDVRIARAQANDEMVALSMLVSQPVPSSAETPKGDIESGEWVQAYLQNERAKASRFLQQHEVVVVPEAEVSAGVFELVERFRRAKLEPIKQMWLREKE